MSVRRENREAAVQFLYMISINSLEGPDDLAPTLRRFFEDKEKDREFYNFGEELIHGTLENLEAVDTIIKEHTVNWDFSRIARIDLAILRLAVYEMTFRDDIPPIVSINEAIDLSKTFSIADSKRFINGILDRYKDRLQRPLREARE